MIYITGDTHGNIDFKKLLTLKEQNITYSDTLIICGDAGIVWNIKTIDYFIELYSSIGCTIIYIDGNHENFDFLSMFRIVEYHGALMHRISEHIFHVFRGEIMIIENKTFLCIGGAISIDKDSRIEHISYWKDEEITMNDINNAIENLSKYNNKVDYVITHCCDTKTVIKAFGYRRDACTDQLMFIDHIVKYKHWYFGHYHEDKLISKKKTCIYQKIINI